MPCAALERHPATPCAALRGITASIERRSDGLQLVYTLEGEIGRLLVPAPRPPRAAERLWQHTCCEAFVARSGSPGYWEFNLSPSGEWAAYEFKRYREGAATAGFAVDITVSHGAGRLTLAACIPFEERSLRVGLSAVVEETGGALSYWALRHAPGEPDFHRDEAFALELE
jgi:hypothetical protein